jgi:hypothetical protein
MIVYSLEPFLGKGVFYSVRAKVIIRRTTEARIGATVWRRGRIPPP